MKRIITLLLTLVLACCLFACDSCGDTTSRKNPTLTDTSSVFASIKETVDGKEYTYNVLKGELYLSLKNEFGNAALTNLVDKYLLNDYYNAVTE